MPSPIEWMNHNVYVKALVILNVKNPIGLGVDISRSTSKSWESLTKIYWILQP